MGTAVPDSGKGLFDTPSLNARKAARLVTSFSVPRDAVDPTTDDNENAKLVVEDFDGNRVYEIRLDHLISSPNEEYRGTDSKDARKRGVSFDDFVFTIDVVSARKTASSTVT